MVFDRGMRKTVEGARICALVLSVIAMIALPVRAHAEIPAGAEGRAIEIPLPGETTPGGLALGPDGNFWVTLNRYSGPSEIAQVTPGGSVRTFPVPASAQVTEYPRSLAGITQGPDGNLWFASAQGEGARLGAISASGEVRVVPLLRPDRWPSALATGPGGHIWFTVADPRADSWIGDLSPNGEVHEYLQRNEWSDGIIPGPEGDMWFLGAGSVAHYPSVGQVGRISPAGRISRFQVPGSEGVPNGIAASGGRIWFGYEADHNLSGTGIANVAGNGRISELPLPTPNGASGYVTSVAPAPGGGAWFVGNDPQILGQVTAGGEVRRTLLQAEPGYFGSLTVGAEGELWATSVREGTLLRIEPRIPGTRLRQLGPMRPRGPVRVRLTCNRGPRSCRGTVRISHQRTGETCCGAVEVAFARYRVRAGGTMVVPVELSRASRAELGRAARRGHFVSVGSFEPGGFASSRPLRVAGARRAR